MLVLVLVQQQLGRCVCCVFGTGMLQVVMMMLLMCVCYPCGSTDYFSVYSSMRVTE
jgi:uncharacterized membrane protein YraQ (UPF0718 family)